MKGWEEALREIFLFLKISLRDDNRYFSFREKQVRDGFNVTFSLVRKSNQKVHQRAAKRRCKIAPLWIPEERFKTRAGGL